MTFDIYSAYASNEGTHYSNQLIEHVAETYGR